jgi:hypothetical protein
MVELSFRSRENRFDPKGALAVNASPGRKTDVLLAWVIVVLTALTAASMAGARPGTAQVDTGDAGESIVFTDGPDSASEIYVRSMDGIRRRLTRKLDWGTLDVSSSPSRTITQRWIGGAQLALSRQAYVRMFGRPRVNRLEKDLMSLVFTKPGLEVYLRRNAGVAVSTSSSAFRTSAGVGPCSPVSALKAACGGQLRELRTPGGPVSLYRLGALVFRVDEPRQRVGAVTLGRGSLARLIAGNAIDCGAK